MFAAVLFLHLCYSQSKQSAHSELPAQPGRSLVQPSRSSVRLLWECGRSILLLEIFRVLWDYSRTFNHTEFYIDCPDLYLEWLCHYWATAAKSRETRVSLLQMMCLELTPAYLEEAEDLPETSDEDDPQYSAFV